MDTLTNITKIIARSHMYWGRKPIADLINIFEDVKRGDIVLDPFCGGGNPALTALMKGGRVIAGDLNPMAIFLTKVLIRPINLASLKSDFECIATIASRNILKKYEIKCPTCKQTAIIKYIVWDDEKVIEAKPVAAQIECSQCGKQYLDKLSTVEMKKQLELSKICPKFWFPKSRINSTRTPPFKHHYELFTGRNLSMLAELLHAIKQIPSQNSQNALLYVFTAMLYSCSSMQMFSKNEPSSSRGWQALRFYIPPKRKEMNIWSVFEGRYNNFIKCKEVLNRNLPSVRVTDSVEEFSKKNLEVLLCQIDAFDLINQVGRKSNLVFIDPPYRDDIDYFGFSEFWGAWLQMDFDYAKEWHPKTGKAELLGKLLKLLYRVTPESSEICLAFAPNRQKGWDEEDCIKESQYNIQRTGFFNYDNSNKRGVASNRNNRFTILGKKVSKINTGAIGVDENIKQLLPYLRVIDYLYPRDIRSLGRLSHVTNTVYDKTRALAIQLAPDTLSNALKNLKEGDIKKAIENKSANKITYHSLCYALIAVILSEDGWKVSCVNTAKFADHVFGMNKKAMSCGKSISVPKGIAFVAQKNTKKILFCFDDLEPISLKKLANRVINLDDEEFDSICVMIVRDMESMHIRRKIVNADEWPRGFFLCFPEVRRKAERTNAAKYLELCASTPNPAPLKRAMIQSLKAEVSDNIPVGKDIPSQSHYKLRFITPKSFNIIPGQFVMIATTPHQNDAVARPLSWNNIKSQFKIEPTSYLKRPFGIHRAFYPHFSRTYLRKLSLPPTLATVMHTVFPNEFEIFYKVQPNGVGTKELTELKKGAELELIGPLGNGINMRDIRSEGFEEIHVIGGGVGMAPLIFMVQALQYYSYTVKAFIGIEKLGMLKYKHESDGLDPSFHEDPKAATLYIDDLIDIGIKPDAIHVSTTNLEKIDHKIPEHNLYQGFVTDQYRKYLQASRSLKKTLAFACGPMGMMKALAQIAQESNVQLKVLMEKRMACGIGVCLSCVCETKSGEGNYSRVCTDGPIFDSSEIIWEKIR